MEEEDEFIGYEIPVELAGYEVSERSDRRSPVFNLESLGVDPRHTRFEMMEIHITLYTLSGVLYTNRKGDKRRRRSQASGGCWRKGGRSTKTPISTFDGMTSMGTSTVGGTLSTITDSCSQPGMAGFEMNPMLAPTTAVISSTRHNPESDRPMETFIPSLPLHRLSRGDRQALRYSARWNGDSACRSVDTEEQSCPSFKILRLMNQQQYVPSARAGELSTYEHEQIDLCVFVGRGKELIPIGVVSFVVTGDEETETILNLPVTKPALESRVYDRHFKQSSRKKDAKESFQKDPHNIFTIGTNATLRLGVRAFPQRNFLEADERSAEAREQDEKIFESVLQKILDTELLSNLNEENSLVQNIVEEQKQKIEEEQQQAIKKALKKEDVVRQQNFNSIEAPTPYAAMQPKMFCNFAFLQNPMCIGSDPSGSDIPRQVVTVKRHGGLIDTTGDGDNTIPLTLVSSVSESVTTEGGHSNTRFRKELAKI